jgi:branched-chain amino acid transport system substrate-binding protein
MGEVLQKKGIKNLYLVAPNFQSGRDVITALKRRYKGNVVGEIYTPLTQVDFAAELAQIRAAKPDAMFVFQPTGLAIQFVKQFAQSGMKGQIPLYSAYSVDNMSLPAIGDPALDIVVTDIWSHIGGNEENKKFVQAFVEKYKYLPSNAAAQAYDAARLLDSAVRKINGKIEDKKAFIAALKAADFKSVRGSFSFNTNHFPIQDLFVGKVVKDKDGNAVVEMNEIVIKDYKDIYAEKCNLK